MLSAVTLPAYPTLSTLSSNMSVTDNPPTIETKFIYLPDVIINWPWKRAINSHYEEVKIESNAWFETFGALTPKSLRAFYKCECCAVCPIDRDFRAVTLAFLALLAALVCPLASKGNIVTVRAVS